MTRAEAEKISAEFRAIFSYYTCLADQAKRAIRGEKPAPVVPRLEELQVVDGRVVWNRRPVWSPAGHALTPAQPVRTRWTPSTAQTAYIEAREQRIDAIRVHIQRAMERVSNSPRSPESRALRLAELAFIESLMEQQQRALRGEAAPPEVPAADDELELVDGWLMWKGRPVWWSGYRGESAAAAAGAAPAEASAGTGAPGRQRPRLRRLLALPWRRAAA